MFSFPEESVGGSLAIAGKCSAVVCNLATPTKMACTEIEFAATDLAESLNRCFAVYFEGEIVRRVVNGNMPRRFVHQMFV